MTAPYVIHNRVNEYIDALPTQRQRGYAEAYYRVDGHVDAGSIPHHVAAEIREDIEKIKSGLDKHHKML